jgi:predicted transposase/invertase (TIGR01784 family)
MDMPMTVPDDKWFGLTNDLMFKIVFGTKGNEPLLCRLLNALLEYEGEDTIVELNIENPILLPDRPKDKLGILDIRAIDRSGRILCVEVQNQDEDALLKRMLFYLVKKFSEQIKSGDSYHNLKKTLGLWILGKDFVPRANSDLPLGPGIHSYSAFDNKTGKKNSINLLELHIVELKKYNKNKEYAQRTKFEKWLHILKFSEDIRSMDDLPDDLKEEEGIKEVVTKMFEANADDRLRDYMFSLEMQMLDERTRLYSAIESRNREIAKNLLSTNLSIEDIIKATGLTREQILSL